MQEFDNVSEYAGYISDEFYYSTRYFAVTFTSDDEVERVITSHTAAVEPTQAVTYANTVMKRWFKFGSYDDYYYMVSPLKIDSVGVRRSARVFKN